MEIKVEEIYAFKMQSGQELVAKIEAIDDDYYHILYPLTIGQGQKGMEFLQAMFCSELGADAVLPRASVMVSPARDDVKEVYAESCKPASDILTPNKQIITG